MAAGGRPCRAAARAWTREWCERHAVRGAPRCPLYLARSSLPGAGLGVFCTRDLPAGAWVTPYDGEARFVGPMACAPGRVLDYALEVPGGAEAILGVAPATPSERAALGQAGRLVRGPRGSPRGFGHLLNDAVHAEVTGRANNCAFRFRGRDAYIVTTRAVPAGRELLVGYHVTYWAARGVGDRRPKLPATLSAFCAAARAAARVVARDVGPTLELDEYVGAGAYAFVDPDPGARARVVVELGWAGGPRDGEPVVLEVRQNA